MIVVFDDLVVPKFGRVMMYTTGYAFAWVSRSVCDTRVTFVTLVMLVTAGVRAPRGSDAAKAAVLTKRLMVFTA